MCHVLQPCLNLLSQSLSARYCRCLCPLTTFLSLPLRCVPLFLTMRSLSNMRACVALPIRPALKKKAPRACDHPRRPDPAADQPGRPRPLPPHAPQRGKGTLRTRSAHAQQFGVADGRAGDTGAWTERVKVNNCIRGGPFQLYTDVKKAGILFLDFTLPRHSLKDSAHGYQNIHKAKTYVCFGLSFRVLVFY